MLYPFTCTEKPILKFLYNKFFSIYNYLFRFFCLFGFQWTFFASSPSRSEDFIFDSSKISFACEFHFCRSQKFHCALCAPGRPKWTRTTFKILSLASLKKSRLRFLKGSYLYLVLLVGPSGLEPPTSCLSGTRSNLLSYEPMWLVSDWFHLNFGVAQLGEHLPCKQGVMGSNPIISTKAS